MIITFGARTWRSGRSSLSASQIRSNCASEKSEQPVWAPSGSHPSVALIAEIATGAPPSASTPETADQPEQDSYKRRSSFGNRTSTETLPCAATALPQMYGNAD